MKNKNLILTTTFTIFYIITFIRADSYNLNDLRNLVSKHIENVKKISELEKKLSSYKFTSGNEFFNIINRKSIEKNIQKRNQIIKSINELTNENRLIFEKLTNVHELMYADFKNNLDNIDFKFVVDYIDDLLFYNFTKLVYINEDEILSLYKQGKKDILKAKYDSQNIIINNLNNFINKLNIKLKIYQNTDKNSELAQKIKILDKIISDFKLSQKNILSYIQ